MTRPRSPCANTAPTPAGPDGFCSVHRAEDACSCLTEGLTDALENFLDDRWYPHRFGAMRPAYYLDGPLCDDPTLDRIETADNQVVDGLQQLIELAFGRPVEMRYGINFVAVRELNEIPPEDWNGTE